MITKIIETIEKEYAGVVLSSRPLLPLPRDIDVFVPESERRRVVIYLQGEGFSCLEGSSICQARKFIGGECFFIDLMFTPNLMQKKLSGTSDRLTFLKVIPLILRACISRLTRIGTGEIIAIVGPDGSGKSTVSERLSVALFGRTMYMGDYALVLQKFYDRLYKRHIAISRLAYLFIYVENWFRYSKAFILSRILGKTVLVDRYPGLNRQMSRNNIWLKLNDLMYWFFPSADRYIFVTAPPTLIHTRCQELTIEEITRSQENIRLRLAKKKRFKEIENIDLDACLNEALRFTLESK